MTRQNLNLIRILTFKLIMTNPENDNPDVDKKHEFDQSGSCANHTPSGKTQTSANAPVGRPSRVKRPPQHLQDYVLGDEELN